VQPVFWKVAPWQTLPSGVVAMSFPSTVLLKIAQSALLGQQESPGKHRHCVDALINGKVGKKTAKMRMLDSSSFIVTVEEKTPQGTV
jgi:hypothetical protein